MLGKLLIEEQEEKSMIEFLKSINIKVVVYMSAAAAWEDISALTLAKSWASCWVIQVKMAQKTRPVPVKT